jgi:hypothetical protein
MALQILQQKDFINCMSLEGGPDFVDITETKSGPIPAPTIRNTVAALLLMPEVECWQDMFTGKKIYRRQSAQH